MSEYEDDSSSGIDEPDIPANDEQQVSCDVAPGDGSHVTSFQSPDIPDIPTHGNQQDICEISHGDGPIVSNLQTLDPDLKEYELTSTEDFDRIEINDPLVEVIGFVTNFVAGKYVSQNAYVISFALKNTDEKGVKVVAWNDEARRIQALISPFAVIHINGAKAKETNPRWNCGTIPLHLEINSNTEIIHLGTYVPEKKDLPTVSLSTVTAFNKQTCRITGYIKTNFAVMINQKNSANNSCYGCIAENTLKLPVRILAFASNLMSPYELGDHVAVIGKLEGHAIPLHFEVESMSDITLIDDLKMSRKQLLLAKNMIYLPSTSDSDTSMTVMKKRKIEHSNQFKKK